MQSYFLYASILGVTLYICRESYFYGKNLILQACQMSAESYLDRQFLILSKFCDKEKLDTIKEMLYSANRDLESDKIQYPEWKERMKKAIDEIFLLFESYYYR